MLLLMGIEELCILGKVRRQVWNKLQFGQCQVHYNITLAAVLLLQLGTTLQ